MELERLMVDLASSVDLSATTRRDDSERRRISRYQVVVTIVGDSRRITVRRRQIFRPHFSMVTDAGRLGDVACELSATRFVPVSPDEERTISRRSCLVNKCWLYVRS